MFSSIFLKTLYDKRAMMLWWTLGGVFMTVLTIAFFPTFRDTFGQALQDVPENMKAFLGDASVYKNITSYINLQVFSQMMLLPIILAVILGTGLLAGEEGDGTLQTLLSYPVSRTRIYIEKLLALMVVVGVVSLGSLWLASVAGALVVGESINAADALLATINAWLLACLFGVLGYAIGAAMGRRGLAGAVAGGLAFATYILAALAQGVKELKFIEKLSPFYYYNNPSPLTGSFAPGDAMLFAGAILALAVLGYLIFVRRDIYQR